MCNHSNHLVGIRLKKDDNCENYESFDENWYACKRVLIKIKNKALTIVVNQMILYNLKGQKGIWE